MLYASKSVLVIQQMVASFSIFVSFLEFLVDL